MFIKREAKERDTGNVKPRPSTSAGRARPTQTHTQTLTSQTTGRVRDNFLTAVPQRRGETNLKYFTQIKKD